MSQMDLVRRRAAITRRLTQAITAVKGIQSAKERMRGVSARLDDCKYQLERLDSALWLISKVSELQTATILEQSDLILNSAKRLQQQLDDLALRLDRNKSSSYNHEFIEEGREERDLEKSIRQLVQAGEDLTRRICRTRVGMSGTEGSGFVIDVDVVQKVDREVQKALGERLFIGHRFEERDLVADEHGRVRLTIQDAHALVLTDKVLWNENEAFDHANLFNTDLLEREVMNFKDRKYNGNKAHGRSMILQGVASAECLRVFIHARKED